jgi:hypothetical protein
MALQCPVCRAAIGNSAACRRCKADLTLLTDIESQRGRLLALTCQAIRESRFGDALSQARQAHALRADADSARILAVSSLLTGDFASAYRLAESAGSDA